MTTLEAVLKVLQEAGTPLHYQEITTRVLAAGLWKTEGKTPDATINARWQTAFQAGSPRLASLALLLAAPAYAKRRDKAKSLVISLATPVIYLSMFPRVAP